MVGASSRDAIPTAFGSASSVPKAELVPSGFLCQWLPRTLALPGVALYKLARATHKTVFLQTAWPKHGVDYVKNLSC